MKRIILGILFLWTIVWGWNTVLGGVVPDEAIKVVEQKTEGEARQHVDQMISVLTEANSCADVSIRPVNPLPTNLIRRYRPGIFSFGCLFSCLRTELDTISNHIFKSFLELSQCHAAQLKDMGYYVYMLRRIIV